MEAHHLLEIPPGQRAAWFPLLRLADDSERAVAAYLDEGTLFGLRGEDGGPSAELLAVPREDSAVEIVSLAVQETLRGRGLGRWIVEASLRRLKAAGFTRVVVATATSSLNALGFYQRLGFRLDRVERDVFTVEAGYPAGLTEEGIPVRDRVWLDRAL